MHQPLLARCIKAAGSTNAGVLLYRICYWAGRSKVQRNGIAWVAKTRSTWLLETALTLKQYDMALRELKNSSLIETEQHLFRGKNITFVRLLDRGLGLKQYAQE